MTRLRLLVVETHPIQYQAPLFRRLQESSSLDLEVLFLTDFGTAASFDPGFGTDVQFDTDLVEGYSHRFVTTKVRQFPGRARAPGPAALSWVSPRYCDAVLVHGYATVWSWAFSLMAAAQGIPYLMRGGVRWETDQERSIVRRVAKGLIVGPLLRRAAACLAIGTSNRRFYLQYGVRPDRVVDAPNSVDTGMFARAGAEGRIGRSAMLEALDLDPSLPTVLLAAKLQEHKRPLDLLAAARLVRRDANLVLIGDGPLRPDVERAASDLGRARVIGFKNQSEIGLWYGAAEVIVLPSSNEPWGLVVNEAMAAGAVPVVSSAVGCGPDMVRDGVGEIYPVGDVAALAASLDRLVSDPVALERLRESCRITAEMHSIDETARGYERALELVSGRSRP